MTQTGTGPDVGSTSVSTATRVVAVDTACGGLAAVEHLAHRVDLALDGLLTEGPEDSYVLSTHTVREPVGHLVAVLTWRDGPEADEVAARLLAGVPGLAAAGGHLVSAPELAPAAAAAADEGRRRAAGRLARYPGRAQVEQRTTPAAVVAASCIDAVEGLAGVVLTPDADLDLTGFARPTWRSGRCTLLVQQARGVLVPFEVRDQIPCCSDH